VRIFAHWAVVLFGQFLKIRKATQFFPTVQVLYYFLQKPGSTIFSAFLQSHLVTLQFQWSKF
jgi:hypothetical protein